MSVSRLRDIIEEVFASTTLVQMAYLLMGVGIPALRALYEQVRSFVASLESK